MQERPRPEGCSARPALSVVIVGGYALGALAWYGGLPEHVPPVWEREGQGTVWFGAPMVAFLLPTAVAVTDRLLRGLCISYPLGTSSSTHVLAIYDAIMLRVSIFVMGVHGAVLLAMLGLFWGREWAAQIVPLMLGVTLISIGNQLPRTRPNLAIGIRTRGTLSDRARWIRTHRAAGYLVVTCGAAIVLSAIAVPTPVGPAMILLVGPAALVGTWLLIRCSARHADA